MHDIFINHENFTSILGTIHLPSMKYFIGHITTQYDGLEWIHQFTIKANNKTTAIKKAERTNFTHWNDIEVQYPIEELDVQEVTKEEYNTLLKYILINL